MADDWLDQLIADVIQRETPHAEQDRREAERAAQMGAQAPIFWRDFADFLQQALATLHTGLQGRLPEGPWHFQLSDRTHELTFRTPAYPQIACTARPDFATGRVHLELATGSPRLAEGARPTIIPCRFEFLAAGTLILQLNGQTYQHPERAARWLLERAFQGAG